MHYRISICFFLLLSYSTLCQNFYIKQYRISEGLPTDVIKAVNQDSLGFVWIGTDEGLVKYDGVNFTTYKAAMKSKYVKGFLKTSDHRLLVIGDLDLIEIQNRVDTVVFKSLVKGNHSLTDSTISYPKTIFQDTKGDIWLAEPESIVRYKDGKIERYYFGREYSSNDFNRSFQFFEDSDKNLYMVAYGGDVFLFNRYRDKFEQIKGKLCGSINHILCINQKLIIASNEGLYTANIDKWSVSGLVKSGFSYEYVSSLLLAPDSSLWIGTFSNELTRVDKIDELNKNKLNFKFKRTNSIYLSTEGDYWVSTDKGLILLQNQIFKMPDLNSDFKFVESVIESYSNDDIYFCDKGSLYKMHQVGSKEWEKKKIYQTANGYLQTLKANESGIWITDAYSVLLFKNDKLYHSWDFANLGHYVFDIYCDKNKNIWLAQTKSDKVIMIDSSLGLHKYKLPISPATDTRVIGGGEKGIYVASKGNVNEYLLLKPQGSDKFENISVPLGFKVSSEFQISNIAIQRNIVWLATSHGLLRYEDGKIERVNLGESYTDFNVSVVNCLNDENILFANSFGLFRYNTKTKEYWVYDENMGLPANTITDHGICIDKSGRVWIGTSHGIAYTSDKALLKSQKTVVPYCIDAKVDGKPVLYSDRLKAPFGSYIYLVFSSISFPENKISLQWKFNNGNTTFSNEWQDMKTHELNFSDLSSGIYELQIRAKKNTGLSWSDPRSLYIEIDKPFWMSPMFIMLIAIAVLIIIWLSYLVSAMIMNKRRAYLQNLVKMRTNDLEVANQELSQRNQELDRFVYSASHDLGAPLKSLLGLISITKMEESRVVVDRYLGMMEGSVQKLDNFIKEVISYSRNSRMELKYEPIDFSNLIGSLLEDYKYSENYEKINFIVEDYTNEKLVSDISRLKIILNNLISNAIKFHRYNQAIKPFIRIVLHNTNLEYRLIVEDNGRGIPSEHLNSIFNMFFRATEDVQGSGLGLYIMKETIVKLNGTCVVESEVGKGTSFIITFPIPR